MLTLIIWRYDDDDTVDDDDEDDDDDDEMMMMMTTTMLLFQSVVTGYVRPWREKTASRAPRTAASVPWRRGSWPL